MYINILVALKCITSFSHIPLVVQQLMVGILCVIPKLPGRHIAAFCFILLSCLARVRSFIK